MEIDPNPKFMEEITPYIKVETSCSLRKHGIIFLSKRLNNWNVFTILLFKLSKCICIPQSLLYIHSTKKLIDTVVISWFQCLINNWKVGCFNFTILKWDLMRSMAKKKIHFFNMLKILCCYCSKGSTANLMTYKSLMLCVLTDELDLSR